MVQDLFKRLIILAACQSVVKLVLKKTNDFTFINGPSTTCVGYYHSKRLKQ